MLVEMALRLGEIVGGDVPEAGWNVLNFVIQAFQVVGQAVDFLQDNALMSLMLGFSLIPLGFKAFKSGKRAAK